MYGSAQPGKHLQPARLGPRRRLLPVTGDWPAQLRNVGAPAVPAALRAAWGEGTVPPELRAWLVQGEPPVFFGFGSMPVLDPSSAVEMITGVAGRLGVRALIGAGWSGLAAGVRDEKIFINERVDYDLVLPRCRAAVHHGVGTTHTVLRAGLPAVVAHVFADQSLWGRRVQAIGAGTTMPYQSLDARRLEDALRPLLAAEVTLRNNKRTTQLMVVANALVSPPVLGAGDGHGWCLRAG